MSERMVMELPVTDAGCGSIRIVASSTRLDAQYQYFSESLSADRVGTIRFNGLRAYRFRSEMHSLGFAEGSYDALVEIADSPWRQELLKIEPSGIWGSVEDKRHFAVLFSNNGYLEVIAETFEELPSREGLLESPVTTDSD